MPHGQFLLSKSTNEENHVKKCCSKFISQIQFLLNNNSTDEQISNKFFREKTWGQTQRILSEEIIGYTGECWYASTQQSLLQEYGFVTSFGKTGVVAKSIHY
jgi:hypothetical protein